MTERSFCVTRKYEPAFAKDLLKIRKLKAILPRVEFIGSRNRALCQEVNCLTAENRLLQDL